MFYKYFILSLLFISTFGKLGINLFEHESKLNPIKENCSNQPNIEITPNYESFINGFEIRPCVWGNFINGMELRYVWIQYENNKILIDKTVKYSGNTTYQKMIGEKENYFNIWKNIEPNTIGDFSVPIRVELYSDGILQDTVNMTINRPLQEVGNDEDVFAIKTVEPTSLIDCIEDDSDSSIDNALSIGNGLYICVIYKIPIISNKNIKDDSLNTIFTINVKGEISGTFPEEFKEYNNTFNDKRYFVYTKIRPNRNEKSLQVIASMISYGEEFTEIREASFK